MLTYFETEFSFDDEHKPFPLDDRSLRYYYPPLFNTPGVSKMATSNSRRPETPVCLPQVQFAVTLGSDMFEVALKISFSLGATIAEYRSIQGI